MVSTVFLPSRVLLQPRRPAPRYYAV